MSSQDEKQYTGICGLSNPKVAHAHNSWQQAETALFALRAVNLSLKERLLGRGGAAADAAGSHNFLVELLSRLCAEPNTGLFCAHAAIREQTARLLGAYANPNPKVRVRVGTLTLAPTNPNPAAGCVP